MQLTLDLPSVRRFTEDLQNRVLRCENGEGMVCSNLEESIQCYIRICNQLRWYINGWARAVFTGEVPFDPAVEMLLKESGRVVLRRAKQTAAQGRAMLCFCFELKDLDRLHFHIADFDYLLENWVSPRLATAPGARVNVPDAAAQEIIQSLGTLPGLPDDWVPSDPIQLDLFREHGGK